MTSLTGGEPETRTREPIAEGWARGLAPPEHVHHRIRNVRVHVDGGTADASCHGIAHHHRRHPSGRNTRVFVGHYDFRLHEEGGRWRITSMRFTVRIVDGNATRERDDRASTERRVDALAPHPARRGARGACVAHA